MTQARAFRPDLLLYFAGGVVALSYLANIWVATAPPVGPAWKCAGVVLLAAFALSRRAWRAGAALAACAAGDVLLELQGLFTAGMAAFALGHALYIACFLEWRRVLGENRRDRAAAILVVLVSIGLGASFVSGMVDLLVPAILYQLVITVMVVSALLAKAPMAARMGALLFMASDTLIAAEKFRDAAVPPGAVWLSYAAAQLLMAWGLSRIAPYRERTRRQANVTV